MPETPFERQVRAALSAEADKQPFDPETARPAASSARRRLKRDGLFAFGLALLAVFTLVRISGAYMDAPIPAVTPSIGPPGHQMIAFVDGGAIKTIHADGTSETVVVPPCADGSCRVTELSWTPDASRLIFAPRQGPRLHVVDVESGELRDLVGCSDTHPLAWSPDGARVTSRSKTPAYIGGHRLFICDAGGGDVRRVSPHQLPIDWEGQVSFSPDGGELAYFARFKWDVFPDSPDGGVALVIADSDGTDPSAVYRTSTFSWKYELIWSPDGRRFAFLTVPKQTARASRKHPLPEELWVVNADGSDPHVVLESAAVAGAAWSPDGAQLAVVTFSGSDRDRHAFDHASMSVVNPDGGGRTTLAEGYISSRPAWDPSGRLIALVLDHELVIVPTDGSPQMTVARSDVPYSWPLAPTVAWQPSLP